MDEVHEQGDGVACVTTSDVANEESDVRIAIMDQSNREAVTIRPSQDVAGFETGKRDASLAGLAGRLGATLQAAPSMLVAGEAAGKQLMEVVVNGSLVRASDGNGWRAFAMGPKGVKEHARLFDTEKLQNMINAGAVWQVASVIVAQKHLADISRKLDEISSGVRQISDFLDEQRRSQIQGAYRYLEQARNAIEAGDMPSSVRMELEHCERDLLSLQLHLDSEFRSHLKEQAKHVEAFGTEELALAISQKIRRQETLLRDIALCVQTRICAWHVFSLFPGEPGLKESRRRDIQQSIDEIGALAAELTRHIERETGNMHSRFNRGSTLTRRREALRQQAAGTAHKITSTRNVADRAIADTVGMLQAQDATLRLLVQFQNGAVHEVRQSTPREVAA